MEAAVVAFVSRNVIDNPMVDSPPIGGFFVLFYLRQPFATDPSKSAVNLS